MAESSYRVHILPAALADLERTLAPARGRISRMLELLAAGTRLGSRYRFDMPSVYSFSVEDPSGDYRIGYLLDDEQRLVIVLAVSPEHGFAQSILPRYRLLQDPPTTSG